MGVDEGSPTSITSELEQQFHQAWGALSPGGKVLLAVSGGPDSMALMLLVQSLPHTAAKDVAVATVDHGLRPESREEAEFVAETAAQLGLSHTILSWQGPKPATGQMAAARSARYRLLIEHANEIGARGLVTGHHAGDVVETFLMRLSRGSGLDGLAEMTRRRTIAAIGLRPITLIRPLLTQPKADLRVYVQSKGVIAIDDPSNENDAYERPRMRALAATLDDQGLASTAIATSAQRLAADAVERKRAEEDRLRRLGGVFYGWGGASCEARRMSPVDDKHLFARLCRAIVGAPFAPDTDAVEAALSEALDGRLATIGGAMIARRQDTVWVFREPAGVLGRKSEDRPVFAAPLNLAAGQSMLWDRRFVIENRSGSTMVIQPFGADRSLPPTFVGPKLAAQSAPVLTGAGEASPLTDPEGTWRVLAKVRFFDDLWVLDAGN